MHCLLLSIVKVIEPGHTVEQTIVYIGQSGQMVMRIGCFMELNLLKTFLSYPFLVLGVLEKGVGCLGGGDGVNIQQQVSQITKLAEHKKLFFLLPVKAPKVAG